MESDALGDRMKIYERMGSGGKVTPLLPVLARIDGRAFHSFVEDLARPFDHRLSRMMIDTTIELVKETNALIGYCQSDEISLCWHTDDPGQQIFFDGRIAKMTSQLAAMATLYFYELCLKRLPPKYAAKRPTFDCRVWTVPTKMEAAKAFLWREQDATKNSISMAARALYEHRELENKNGPQMQEMLWAKGVNWNTYPRYFKRGTFIRRKVVAHRFSAEELEALPPLHNARRNPELTYDRSVYAEIEMPRSGRSPTVKL